jgi:lysine-N-methylase
MPAPQLQLPLIQNWSCHNCGGCCRQHLIEITAEERQQILRQHWTAEDGIPDGQPTVVWFAGLPWKKRYRLAHRADGACVFLDDRGLCRIHAKFGETAKPLPCQIYPYALHPAGKKVTVSLRFSCPSVVANRGKAVGQQTTDLKRIAELIVPPGADRMRPPAVSRRARVDWPEFQQLVNALDATFAQTQGPLVLRLLRALFWVRLVEQSKFDAIRGQRLAEYLKLVTEAAIHQVPLPENDMAIEHFPQPSRAGRLLFRMLAAHYARRDTFAESTRGWRGRARLLQVALRFARGRGLVPSMQECFRRVPFERLDAPFGPISEEADAILTRFFRVKIQGLHFCGPAYYGVPFVQGFYSLALLLPVVLWLSRWLAASQARDCITTDDVARALAIADHHHGYSPVLGGPTAQVRVRLLAHRDDLERLCAWYSR